MSFLFLSSKFLSVHLQKNVTIFKRSIFWYREKKLPPFVVIRARQEDYCDVVNLLWKCYYPDEPTYMSLKLGYTYQPIFDELAYCYLQEGLSYLVKCNYTYEIVGGCINKACSPWEPGQMDRFACSLACPELRHLYQFRAYIQKAPCLWQNYCTDQVFELKSVFVRRQDRKRGVAKLLVEASRKLGADCGYKNAKSYLLVRAQQREYESITKMLWKHYYPDEPLTNALGLANKYNPLFDNEILKDLTEGMTILAKCKHSGDIVGGCINKTSYWWDWEYYEKVAAACVSPELRNMYKFCSYLHRVPRLWERYNIDKVYEMKILFVRKQNRQQGIAKSLLESSKGLGFRCNYKLVRCDATSPYTDRVCTKLKMKMVHDIPYCSYTGDDPEHTPVFKAPLPHTGCRVFIDTPLYEYNK